MPNSAVVMRVFSLTIGTWLTERMASSRSVRKSSRKAATCSPAPIWVSPVIIAVKTDGTPGGIGSGPLSETVTSFVAGLEWQRPAGPWQLPTVALGSPLSIPPPLPRLGAGVSVRSASARAKHTALRARAVLRCLSGTWVRSGVVIALPSASRLLSACFESTGGRPALGGKYVSEARIGLRASCRSSKMDRLGNRNEAQGGSRDAG